MDKDGNPVTLTDEQMQPADPAPTGTQPDPPEEPEEKPELKGEQQEEAEEPEKPEEPEEPEEPEVPEEPEEKPVSRRESKRIEQLLEKLQEREQPEPPRQPQGNDQIIPEGEYDIEQINKMAQEYGKGLYQEGLSQARDMQNASLFSTRLEIDAPRVASKYTFLDTESDDFNPGPASFINEMYLKTVGYNPKTGVVRNGNLRYNEFVEGFMEAVELVASGKVAESSKNVTKQVAKTGIRPGGIAKKSEYSGDDPRRMSNDELDAAIKSGLGI